jgi:putative transport protein
MEWLFELYQTNPVAQAIAIISLVCMFGMTLGSIKVRGIGLGTAGVLFAGILVGHVSKPIDHKTLEFVKEFGLVLFVFCIGLQLGPGFFASLRQHGWRLNVLAATIVLLGACLAPALGWLLRMDFAAVVGLFAGATTNTPALGAAQQTLSQMENISQDRAALPALAYAVSYPAAIAGIIATILLLKRLFRIDPVQQAAAFAAEQSKNVEPLERRVLEVDSAGVEGLTIEAVVGLSETDVVVSRIKRRDAVEVLTATHATTLHWGDLILAVGTLRNLDRFQRFVGQASSVDLTEVPSTVTHRRVIATNRAVLGKTVRQLGLEQRFGVTVTRVARAGLEMAAAPNLRLQFGDDLQVVGDEANIQQAAELLGNSLKALNETHFIPLFAGIAAGIALGTLPVTIADLPQPLRLGLAGGPLIVAILVGRLGRVGPLVWHMPASSNLAFREFGIALFFASVGLLAGPQFFSIVFSERGLVWLGAGICVTVVPILAVGIFALAVWKLNFVSVSGLIAGSMTDPPALAFATNVCDSETPMVAYATVYPLTTMLRILSAQVLAVALCG